MLLTHAISSLHDTLQNLQKSSRKSNTTHLHVMSFRIILCWTFDIDKVVKQIVLVTMYPCKIWVILIYI